MQDDEFLTVKQVSEILQVHWQTVLNYIKSGKLRAISLGKGYRIEYKEFNKFLRSNRTK